MSFSKSSFTRPMLSKYTDISVDEIHSLCSASRAWRTFLQAVHQNPRIQNSLLEADVFHFRSTWSTRTVEYTSSFATPFWQFTNGVQRRLLTNEGNRRGVGLLRQRATWQHLRERVPAGVLHVGFVWLPKAQTSKKHKMSPEGSSRPSWRKMW